MDIYLLFRKKSLLTEEGLPWLRGAFEHEFTARRNSSGRAVVSAVLVRSLLACLDGAVQYAEANTGGELAAGVQQIGGGQPHPLDDLQVDHLLDQHGRQRSHLLAHAPVRLRTVAQQLDHLTHDRIFDLNLGQPAQRPNFQPVRITHFVVGAQPGDHFAAVFGGLGAVARKGDGALRTDRQVAPMVEDDADLVVKLKRLFPHLIISSNNDLPDKLGNLLKSLA